MKVEKIFNKLKCHTIAYGRQLNHQNDKNGYIFILLVVKIDYNC